MKLLDRLERLIDGITMYRLLLYCLILIVAAGAVGTLAGRFWFSFPELVISVIILGVASFIAKELAVRLFRADANYESTLISFLILALILPPPASVRDGLVLALAGVIVVLSKFIVAFRQAHIFNPAALTAAILTLTGLLPASWWVGSTFLLPVVALCGLLILRKTRNYQLFAAFAIAALAAGGLTGQAAPGELLKSWPLVFMGAIMLTEPYTMPTTRLPKLAYGIIVGILFGAHPAIGPLQIDPQLSLLLGNLYVFGIFPRQQTHLKLIGRRRLAANTYEAEFAPSRQLKYLPGQYFDLTLATPLLSTDGRGNRRTFSIASSPSETNLRIGFKLFDPSSTFKRRLMTLPIGTQLTANRVGGEFVLPADRQRPVAAIAGGIGITPFRSMAKFLTDNHQSREFELFYVAKTAVEMAYTETFNEAKAVGIKVTPVVDKLLEPEAILKQLPDAAKRVWYVAGPNPMVRHYRQVLRGIGVPHSRIKTDFFSGY